MSTENNPLPDDLPAVHESRRSVSEYATVDLIQTAVPHFFDDSVVNPTRWLVFWRTYHFCQSSKDAIFAHFLGVGGFFHHSAPFILFLEFCICSVFSNNMFHQYLTSHCSLYQVWVMHSRNIDSVSFNGCWTCALVEFMHMSALRPCTLDGALDFVCWALCTLPGHTFETERLTPYWGGAVRMGVMIWEGFWRCSLGYFWIYAENKDRVTQKKSVVCFGLIPFLRSWAKA